MKQKKSSWMSALFAYAKNAKGELGLSVVLSVVSILLGLVPFCSTTMLSAFLMVERRCAITSRVLPLVRAAMLC